MATDLVASVRTKMKYKVTVILGVRRGVYGREKTYASKT